MYQRDLAWENYLHRFGFKEDLSQGLTRINLPPVKLAGYARIIATESELKSILERSLVPPALNVDARTVTPESLQSSFDWAMGSILWKMELPRQSLLDLVSAARSQATQPVPEARRRAEIAYLNGGYTETIRAFQSLDTGIYQDFSLYLTAGHIYLYHQKPVELDKARAAYLKAGVYAMPRAPLYAGRALLWAAFVAYLQRDDVSALEYAQRALQVTPQWGEAWYTQARIAAATHQPAQAIPSLEQAIRADRNYALRAATDLDFESIEEETTALYEQLRQGARQQAETHGKSLYAETSTSPLPTQDQVTSQRLQGEIAERWRQDSYFGYLDAAGKMMRFKLYVDGLRLPDRDRLVTEAHQALAQLHRDLGVDTVSAGLKERFQTEIQGIENALAGVPNLVIAQVALNKAHQAQALWRLATSQTTLNGHTGEVNSVVFNPGGQWLASAATLDQNIRLWDIFSGETYAMLAGHTDGVNTLLFTPDGQTLASAGGRYKGEDFTVRLWEVPGGHSKAVLDGHTNMVTTLAVEPGGKLLASASADAKVYVWSLPTGEKRAVLVGHQGGVTCLAINPGGTLLVSGGEDQTIRLWEVETATQAGVLLGHEAPLTAVYLTPDGKNLISAAADQTIRVWDVVNHQLLSVHEQPGRITAIALSPDGCRLAWAIAEDGKLRLWTPGQDQPPLELAGHTSRINCLAFSADGQMLASGSEDGMLRLWDATSGKGKAMRSGHSGQINTLTFSPDGALLATGGQDKTVRLWGLVLSQADAEAIAAEEQDLHDQAIKEQQEAAEKAERQRKAWLREGRCEVCGKKLSLMDRISRHTRCKEHLQTTPG
jgi:WD40 repeat protein